MATPGNRKEKVIDRYYRNFEAPAKAQAGYMFWSMLFFAVGVAILIGKGPLVLSLVTIGFQPKELAEVVPIGSYLAIHALLGTYPALAISRERLVESLTMEDLEIDSQKIYPIDPVPNLFDLLVYRNEFVGGEYKGRIDGFNLRNFPALSHPIFIVASLVVGLQISFVSLMNDVFDSWTFAETIPLGDGDIGLMTIRGVLFFWTASKFVPFVVGKVREFLGYSSGIGPVV